MRRLFFFVGKAMDGRIESPWTSPQEKEGRPGWSALKSNNLQSDHRLAVIRLLLERVETLRHVESSAGLANYIALEVIVKQRCRNCVGVL